jgi:hypothetical protein
MGAEGVGLDNAPHFAHAMAVSSATKAARKRSTHLPLWAAAGYGLFASGTCKERDGTVTVPVPRVLASSCF